MAFDTRVEIRMDRLRAAFHRNNVEVDESSLKELATLSVRETDLEEGKTPDKARKKVHRGR